MARDVAPIGPSSWQVISYNAAITACSNAAEWDHALSLLFLGCNSSGAVTFQCNMLVLHGKSAWSYFGCVAYHVLQSACSFWTLTFWTFLPFIKACTESFSVKSQPHHVQRHARGLQISPRSVDLHWRSGFLVEREPILRDFLWFTPDFLVDVYSREGICLYNITKYIAKTISIVGKPCFGGEVTFVVCHFVPTQTSSPFWWAREESLGLNPNMITYGAAISACDRLGESQQAPCLAPWHLGVFVGHRWNI